MDPSRILENPFSLTLMMESTLPYEYLIVLKVPHYLCSPHGSISNWDVETTNLEMRKKNNGRRHKKFSILRDVAM